MPETDLPTFAELLTRYRIAAGLTQEELAQAAGLSAHGISDLERGARRSPRLATVRLLADALRLNEAERAAFLAAARRGQSGNRSVPPAAPAPSEQQPVAPRPRSLPTATVTFLFSDIEGSTRLLQHLGDTYASILSEHQAVLRQAFAAHDGVEVDTQGDSFFAAFPTAPDALAAAARITRALAEHSWPQGVAVRVRIGLHTGAPLLAGNRYVGLDVHRAARIGASGHGGQILLSETTRALVEGALPEPGALLRDLGAHRLKDLQRAEHLYQLVLQDLPSDFPPLKTLEARPHNLPLHPTPLLGREQETAAMVALLQREDVRLVTLTGPGGVGKTRLGLEVAAAALDDFADGVWWVPLSRLTDPSVVLPTIADALDVKTGAMPAAAVLRTALCQKHLLLALDNFEQVAAAAPEIAELLAACPHVKCFITSRVSLRLLGEREFALRPLPAPDERARVRARDLYSYAATALFIDRARAVRQDLAITDATAPAIAQICARLDGLPLAIELAAARVRILPPEALLAQLSVPLKLLTGGPRDAEERQQTMRAAIAWSYNLLAPEEQRLFRRLAVFVGGCTLATAEAVCAAPEGASPLGIDLLDGLSALVENSLVQQHEEAGEPRFTMLHIIREYALEQLEASGELRALCDAHALGCLAHFEVVISEIAHSRDSQAGWPLLKAERDNIRAALAWTSTEGDVTVGLDLFPVLTCGPVVLADTSQRDAWGERLLDRLLRDDQSHQMLARARESRRWDPGFETAGRVAAADAASHGAWLRGDNERALALETLALQWAQEDGRPYDIAITTHNLALTVLIIQHDVSRGLALEQEGLALMRQAGLHRQACLSQAVFSEVLLLSTGDEELARAQATETLALSREHGYHWVRSLAQLTLAIIAARRGEIFRAKVLAREAMARQDHTRTWHLDIRNPIFLLPAAMICRQQGQHERAARLLGAVKAFDAYGGAGVSIYGRGYIDPFMTPARAALSEEAWAAAFAAGEALSPEEALSEADAVLDEDLSEHDKAATTTRASQSV